MPPKIAPHIVALPATIPFVAPERTERETGRRFAARLGANEGNFGCSPHARAAMEKAARDDVGNYCDPECFDLRAALAAHLGIDMRNIVAGPGIDGLLGLIVRIFSSPGDAILTSLGAYPTLNYHVAAYDRVLHTVAYRDDKEDLDALVQRAGDLRPAIVYVSNPDNPMGTWWNASDIRKLMDDLPAETLLILDEAYGETAPEGTLPAIELNRPNVLRLRTFSKAYGLAGLRCGYAIGHRTLIEPFDKVRDHFGVNIMAQKAATAAIGDQVWLADAVRRNEDARDTINVIARAHGLVPLPSATNFVTLDCGRDGDFAKQVLDGLMAHGIFVRKPMAPGLDRCIRISAGRAEELDVLNAALTHILDDLR